MPPVEGTGNKSDLNESISSPEHLCFQDHRHLQSGDDLGMRLQFVQSLNSKAAIIKSLLWLRIWTIKGAVGEGGGG